MHSLSILAMFTDEGFAGAFNSPQIVPIFGTLMILGIVVASIWAGVRKREMESQERLAGIAKGIAPSLPMERLGETSTAPLDGNLVQQRNRTRLTGLVLSSVGLGLATFGLLLTWIVREREVYVVAATGLIPMAIGIGFLIDARLKSRELERSSRLSGTSELRPLH
ncbi:MAG: DUF6249 domain-containing protein [Janthinobacterium lividum]